MPSVFRRIKAKKGAVIPSPYHDDPLNMKVAILANTKVGISFRHPKKGLCGMRYEHMTSQEWDRIKDA